MRQNSNSMGLTGWAIECSTNAPNTGAASNYSFEKKKCVYFVKSGGGTLALTARTTNDA